MATSVDFIEYVCAQTRVGHPIRYKKMFGEYMVYVNDKPIFLVCDNTVYVKKLAALDTVMSDAECGVPYNGAKEHYILDIDDAELTQCVTEILESVTPLPKKRAK